MKDRRMSFCNYIKNNKQYHLRKRSTFHKRNNLYRHIIYEERKMNINPLYLQFHIHVSLHYWLQ